MHSCLFGQPHHIYIYVIISCYNRLYPHDISILFSLGHSVTSNCNSTESFGAWHGLIRSFDNAVRRILLFWKRVPIIVCVAYPIVNEFGWPEQALLSRTSNSMFTNIDGFSAIWLIIWYETCLRGSEVGARKMCPANLARLSSSSCGKGDTFLVGWLGNAVWEARSYTLEFVLRLSIYFIHLYTSLAIWENSANSFKWKASSFLHIPI